MNPLAILVVSTTGFIVSSTWLFIALKKKPIAPENQNI